MLKNIPLEFLQQIPKADLHVHLGGSMRLSTLIELAKKQKIKLPSYTEKGLRQRVFKDRYASLSEYLQGFTYTESVLHTAENIERVAYELGQDAIAEGVRYMEVRFSPQKRINRYLTAQESIRAAVRGLERARREHNASPAVVQEKDLPFYFGIIVCAMRNFDENSSPYYRALLKVLEQSSKAEIISTASLELAKLSVKLAHEEKLPIVGFDIAGEEAGYPVSDHFAAYQYVHKHFIYKTVHAGEANGPESIFSALTDCYANRIGHGTNLFRTDLIKDKTVKDKKNYVRALANYLASGRIGIEVCLSSNLQTRPDIKSIAKHPVRKMIHCGLPVTINTDNRLVSNTTVTKELKLLADHIALRPHELKNIVIAGFKSGFFPGSYMEKRRFVRKVIDRYNELARAYNIPLY